MATLEQIEAALRAADAAGNVEDARRLAQAYSQMRSQQAPKPDFGNVTSGGGQYVQDVKATQAAIAARAPKKQGREAYDWKRHERLSNREFTPQEVAGMNPVEKYAYGAQELLSGIPRGLKQTGTSMAEYFVRSNPALFKQRSAESLITGKDDSTAGGLRASLANQEQEEARHRASQGGLMDTFPAKAGSFTATLATAFAPAARLRSLSLPQQIGANAGLGALYSASQPVTPDESRGGNIALGGLLGAGGTAVAPLVSRAVGAVARPVASFTRKGADKQAAAVLRRAAEDEAALSRSAPSAVPGVQRFLAEETLDPGIAQLQRQFPQQLADQARNNNNARVEYLAGAFNGADDASAAAIREGADRMASGAARQLRSVVNEAPRANPFGGLGVKAPAQTQAISLDSVTRGIDGLIAKNNNRTVVKSALEHVRRLSSKPIRSADEAWNLRKEINDLMDGRVGGDLAAATAARRELLTARGLLDRQMTKAMPGWGDFLRNYKGAMRKADQVDVGAHLLKRGGVEGVTGDGAAVRTLQNARFRNLTDDMDRAVQTATGFRRATAQGTLTPQQLGAVGNVRDDVIRSIQADSLGRAVGSPTSQNLTTESLLAGEIGRSRLGALVQKVPGIRWAVDGLNDAG